MRNHLRTQQAALAAAFPHTLPILAGYLFLGMTYGILMRVSGLGIGPTLMMSVFVFAGSMQFAAIDLLVAAFAPLQALLLARYLRGDLDAYPPFWWK